MSDYEILKAAGHSPSKAHDILLDARRGDEHSIKWVAELRAQAERTAA